MEKSDSGNGRNVYFLDAETQVEKEGTDIINITNASRSLILKFKTLFERNIWYMEIKKRSDKMKEILSSNPYNAYTNMKPNNEAQWFSDGESYFADLATKLMEAKETIFITDWWMSPEVWLVRPVPINLYTSMAYLKRTKKETPPFSRLMDILYQCANRGVKVYIQLYAEYTYVLTLDSIHTQSTLTSLHPNIKVERHPLNTIGFLWSHHEKLVIIDQIIGYVGGLDLCWGRFDTNKHPIFEPSVQVESPEYLFPGIDYSNARIRDFENVPDYLKESAVRDKETRMPWHDVHCRLIGPVVTDIARHFVERWNFTKFGTGEGITDIKQNSSVSKDFNKNKTINEDNSVKNRIGGFILNIAKNLGNNTNEIKINSDSNTNEILIPEDDKKEDEKEKLDEPEKEKEDENNINNINNDSEEDKILDTKGSSLKGKTKLRGRRKIKKDNEDNTNNEIKINSDTNTNEILIPDDEKKEDEKEKLDEPKKEDENNINNINNDSEEDNILDTKGSSLKGKTKLRGRRKIKKENENNPNNNNVINTNENEELTEKERELKEAQERFMQNKDQIDDDHFLIIRPQEPKENEININDESDNTKLRGRNKRNINRVREYRQNLELNKNNNNQINTDSNIINVEEDNAIEIKEKKGPSFYDTFVRNLGEHSKKTDKGWFSNFFGQNQQEEKLENNIVDVKYFRRGIKSKVQTLRSSCNWSVGIKKKEDSILQAYIKLIREAEHYIYIENQFFVSRAYDDEDKKNCKKLSDVVQNTIALEIRKRILRAYEEGKKFRVIVFIPLLPGFAGEPEESGTLQIILKHTYGAICRNYGTSIIEKLREKMGEDWQKYIGFYSLRNHDLINGVPTTEIIYIHSKLMIVDDKSVIIGSANINDRSMLGTRDSEFCVLIQERPSRKIQYLMDGKRSQAAKFAHSFRTHLLAEHMGLDDKDEILFDPLSDELWEKLISTARINTGTYRKLWFCYPDDEMKTFKDVLKMKNPKEFGDKEMKDFRELYQNEKGNIKGHVVEFPLHFLEEEVLGIPFFSKENIVPEKSYT
jgi:phospholipase D1/2